MSEHKGPPSYRQWKLFIKSRQGLLPIHQRENIKVLCLACGLPTDLSACDKITVGSVVDVTEVEEIESEGQTVEVVTHKYVPATAKGNGCKDCQYIMAMVISKAMLYNKVHDANRQPWIQVDPRDADVNSVVSAYYK